MVRVATEIKLVCVGAAMEQWYDRNQRRDCGTRVGIL